MNRPINVEYIHPPIPVRQYDWQATFEGYDEGDPIGWGRTKELAIRDLLDQVNDHFLDLNETTINNIIKL